MLHREWGRWPNGQALMNFPGLNRLNVFVRRPCLSPSPLQKIGGRYPISRGVFLVVLLASMWEEPINAQTKLTNHIGMTLVGFAV